MTSIIKFSSKHNYLAYKCLALADACKISVESEQDENCQKISYNQGSNRKSFDNSCLRTVASSETDVAGLAQLQSFQSILLQEDPGFRMQGGNTKGKFV